jgi:hypothetical protein
MSDPASIEHRHLRSAIEYAVVMADEIAKRKAPISVPRELRAVSGKARIPTGSLGRLRRAIDADEAFRTAVAAGALPELVDPIGILWLQRPAGWEGRVERLSPRWPTRRQTPTCERRCGVRRSAAAPPSRSPFDCAPTSPNAMRRSVRSTPISTASRRRREGRGRGVGPACRRRRPAHRGPPCPRS